MERKGALFTVFLAVLIDLMGFGIVLPLLPFYGAVFGATPLQVGLLYSVYSFAQLIFSPLWGSLSDRIGRRPVMLFSTAGSTLAYLLFACSNSLTLLFISRILAGVMGGNISTAQAYVADVTAPADRAKGMGMIGAAFGIGFVLGPALATVFIHPAFLGFFRIAEAHKFSLPGFFAASLSFASFLFVLLKLPETVEAGGKKAAVTPAGILTKAFWTNLAAEKRKGSLFPALILSAFLLSFGHATLYSAFPLFCHQTLSMAPEAVGMQFLLMGSIAVIIQGFLIKQIVHLIPEEKVYFAGNVLMVAGFALLPFAGSVPALTLFLAVLTVGASLNGPTQNSMVSKQADPGMMGAAMGAAQSAAGLGRAVGPAWGGLLFSAGAKLPFFGTGSLLLATFWIARKLQIHSSKS